MKITIIYDTPWQKCDKKWLYNGLKDKYANVQMITPPCTLSVVERRGFIFKIYTRFLFFYMAIKSLVTTKREDIIICWNPIVGYLTSKFANKEKKIISLNWLTPPKKDKTFPLKQIALNRKNTYIGVNSINTKEILTQIYGSTCAERIFFFPDVPTYDLPKEKYKFQDREHYCFTGGMNNRDWSLLIDAATNIDFAFKCVALQTDFENSMDGKPVPKNLEVFYNIPSSDYYDMLQNAWCMVLPLKNDNVAGLINILKCAEFGVLPLTSYNSAIAQYYPEVLKDTLQFEVGNIDDMCIKLKNLLNISQTKYEDYINALRTHIITNFSSASAISRLECIINNLHI